MASQNMIGLDISESGQSGASIGKPAKKRERKQSRIWSMKKNNALVLEVEKYECIWNPVHQDYKKGKLKKVLWEKVQSADNLVSRTGRECCDRWGVMRIAYKRKINQKVKSGDGALEEVALPEPYYHMKFLTPAVEMSKARVDSGCFECEEIDFDLDSTETFIQFCNDMEKEIPGTPSPRANRPRSDLSSSVSQTGNQPQSLEREVLLSEAMKTMRQSDEWSQHFLVSASIIRKAAAEFPDMERKYRSAIMQFNISLDEIWAARQAQPIQVVEINDSQAEAVSGIIIENK